MERAEPFVAPWSPRAQTLTHVVMASGAWAMIAMIVGALA